jgi:hypothetical protein
MLAHVLIAVPMIEVIAHVDGATIDSAVIVVVAMIVPVVAAVAQKGLDLSGLNGVSRVIVSSD